MYRIIKRDETIFVYRGHSTIRDKNIIIPQRDANPPWQEAKIQACTVTVTIPNNDLLLPQTCAQM